MTKENKENCWNIPLIFHPVLTITQKFSKFEAAGLLA